MTKKTLIEAQYSEIRRLKHELRELRERYKELKLKHIKLHNQILSKMKGKVNENRD